MPNAAQGMPSLSIECVSLVKDAGRCRQSCFVPACFSLGKRHEMLVEVVACDALGYEADEDRAKRAACGAVQRQPLLIASYASGLNAFRFLNWTDLYTIGILSRARRDRCRYHDVLVSVKRLFREWAYCQ